MCLVKFCRELNCLLQSLQKSCLKSKPTDSLVIFAEIPVLQALLPREDDDDRGAANFGLDGASSSFIFKVLCATVTPFAVPVVSPGDGAGLLSTSSPSSSSEVSTASSFTQTLLLEPEFVLLLVCVEVVVEGLGVVAAALLVLMLYIL